MTNLQERTLGYELALTYAKLVSMLPIDAWLIELEDAETVAPFLDPTLFRTYLSSSKPQVLKSVLLALLEVKRVVEELQKQVNPNTGENSDNSNDGKPLNFQHSGERISREQP